MLQNELGGAHYDVYMLVVGAVRGLGGLLFLHTGHMHVVGAGSGQRPLGGITYFPHACGRSRW